MYTRFGLVSSGGGPGAASTFTTARGRMARTEKNFIMRSNEKGLE
jgi:hypothetical protein